MKGFSPKAKLGKSKYGPTNGLVTQNFFANLPIATIMAKALSEATNSGLSAQTWSSYKTSRNHLLRCQNETNTLMTFPLTTNKVLVFTSWLLFTRKVKAKSAEVYLSGLRCLHLINGHEIPALRPGIVKLVLDGQNHLDKIREIKSATESSASSSEDNENSSDDDSEVEAFEEEKTSRLHEQKRQTGSLKK